MPNFSDNNGGAIDPDCITGTTIVETRRRPLRSGGEELPGGHRLLLEALRVKVTLYNDNTSGNESLERDAVKIGKP